MGPGSVDAWLTEMVGAEITAEEIESAKNHTVVLSAGTVPLEQLEKIVDAYIKPR